MLWSKSTRLPSVEQRPGTVKNRLTTFPPKTNRLCFFFSIMKTCVPHAVWTPFHFYRFDDRMLLPNDRYYIIKLWFINVCALYDPTILLEIETGHRYLPSIRFSKLRFCLTYFKFGRLYWLLQWYFIFFKFFCVYNFCYTKLFWKVSYSFPKDQKLYLVGI